MDTSSEFVTIPNTEIQKIYSKAIHDTYRLLIALPIHYGRTKRTYPVVYLTYGNMLFPLLWFIVNSLNADWELPRLILVGIGYDTDNPIKMARLRERDFLPTNLQSKQKLRRQKTIYPGQADRFLQFIRTELKPFVESHYRADPRDSSYVGHSHGGLFGLYALFQHPDTFNRYVISSPSLHYDHELVFDYEQAYAEGHDDLPVALFLSAGEREELDDPLIQPSFHFVTNLKRLAACMQSRSYPRLRLNTHIFEGETHASVMSVAFSRGLRAVFA